MIKDIISSTSSVNNMRGAIFLVCLIISFSCLFSPVQCGGNKHDALRKLMKEQRLKKSVSHVSEAAVTEYSPVYVELQGGLKDLDKILELPGQPSVSFDQYSGFVTVDPTAGRALFYYFAEAEESSTKPLVLWLNGGPGCSSLGAGAMTELGPFRVNPDGKTLWSNEKAWNKYANILFLESPAGVGFSYSNTTSDYNTGDKKTAADAYAFLVNWLERFPEYKTRDFYITGESYAGHYVPQLANVILQNNKITNQTVINLKGIAIGNALLDWVDMYQGFYDHVWTSALTSDEIHQGIVKNCNFSSAPEITDVCNKYLQQADESLGDIDIYNIYAPLCGSNSTSPGVSAFDPCTGDYASTYLNTLEVQTALHATVSGTAVSWEECSDVVDYEEGFADSILPLIKELMTTGIRIWIYSGDVDGIIPVTTTRYSMAKIASPVKTPWYPWNAQGEVGGYVVGYENVTFVTVRGAGHLVPSYQSERAFIMFSSFIDGTLPPPQNQA